MATIQDIDLQAIQNATPDSLKASGTAKLGTLIFAQGKVINQLLDPIANKLLSQVTSPDGTCVSQQILDDTISQRNGLVLQLNDIGNNLNKLTNTLTGLSNYLSLAQAVITIIKTSKIATSIAAKILPAVPGIVPATISDLEDAKNQITFTDTGTSKLDKIQGSVSSAAISVSIVNGYILSIVNTLNSLDIILTKCSPDSTFASISKDINDSADAQKQAETTINQTTYNGFIIEIEEIPYTPTVTRRRAIGKNQQGIVLIQTELSFTTNPQTLITELKLIIDRDNLKAY
jgi:hypothetical protein